MVEKITIAPKEVRGLGNIVMEKEAKNFLADKARVQKYNVNVNNITRKVFSVDGGVSTLTPTKLVVDGPTIVDIRRESLDFSVGFYDLPGMTPVNRGRIRCFVGDLVYEEVTDSTGTAEFSIPNEFDEGILTLTFVYNAIQQRGWSYKQWSVTITGDSDFGLCLLPIREVTQLNDVDPLVARYTTGKWGVKNKLIWFFERYIADSLTLSTSKDVSFIGDTVGVSALYVDPDGSPLPSKPVYFFERYAPLSVRASFTRPVLEVDETSTVSAVYRDEDGSGIAGETVYFFERYAPVKVRLWCSSYSVTVGDALLLTGSLRDEDGSAIKGETLGFEVLPPGGDPDEDWIRILTPRTDELGYASCPYTPSLVGEYQFQLVKGKLEAPSVSVNVTGSVVVDSIVLSGLKSVIQSGESNTLTATVLDEYGNGISGVTLDVYKNGSKVNHITSGDDGVATYNYSGTGIGDTTFYVATQDSSIQSEIYVVEDCIHYSSTTYSSSSVLDWSVPSAFELSFIINSGNSTSNNAPYIRFNSSSASLFCGKTGSANRNINLYNGSDNVLNQIPISTDVEYILTYENGVATLTDGTDTVSASMSITKIYQVNGTSNGKIKEIKLKPL